MIAALFANIHRGEDTPPFEVADFMPMTAAEAEAHQARKEREHQKQSQIQFAAAFAGRFRPPAEAQKLTPAEKEEAIAKARKPAERALAEAGVKP